MNTNALLREFDDTFNILIQLLAAFPQDSINTVPFEGSWTAAQTARHLLKGSVAELLYGRVKPTERQPEELLPPLKELFQNSSIQMQSPEVLVPEDIQYDKNRLISELENTAARIRKGIQTLDLTESCLDFEMPQYGFLTRYEWVGFYTVHIQRHTRQLQNIYRQVTQLQTN